MSKTLISLQIARAIAAASVVFVHTQAPYSFGTFGVDIFFILSGFVIAMLVSQRRETPLRFFVSRVARIVPLYWLFTIGVFLLATLHPSLVNSDASFYNLLKSLLFIPYTSPKGVIEPILFVGWSLNYEMLFYALVTIAIAITRYPLLWASIALIASYVIGLQLPGVPGSFLGNERIVEFILGIAAFKLTSGVVKLPKTAAISGAILAYASLAFLETTKAYMFFAVPSLIFVLCLLALEPWLHTKRTALLVHLGDASYATYLTHPYIVGLFKRAAPVVFPSLTMSNPFMVLTVMAIALLVGSLVYIYIDKPSMGKMKRLLCSTISRTQLQIR